MLRLLAILCGVFLGCVSALAGAPLAPPIENPTGQYLVWGDYKIEINQYGDLGRNWPTPDLIWEQYTLLEAKAEANPQPPNTLRAVLLVLPNLEATAVREEDGHEVVVSRKSARMTSAEVRWALEQWRQFEEMVFVYSGGNAWVRTDIKVIDEPVSVTTDENWVFWPGQQRDLLERYIPFERGEYQSYNSIYCSKDLNADPHGGTIGAVYGIKGCGTSDNAWYGEAWKPNRTGYVALHEWLNQQCSATSNILPYPEDETLWSNYVLEKIGYREDVELDDWPWLSARRDTMMHIIRPGMWRRWSTIDPYGSTAIGEWLAFGPTHPGLGRAMSAAGDEECLLMALPMDTYTHFSLASARSPEGEALPVETGTYYFRACVESDSRQEVRLWCGADERFKVHLNGVPIRDGWGWNYSEDDGLLVEKVTYATLERGINTLVLELPNSDDAVEFRVRFCSPDDSGRQPAGVRALPCAVERRSVPFAEPVVHDFAAPRFYRWAEVSDMPWSKLPRLGEEELRELTGVDSLKVCTHGPLYRNSDGEAYEPPQHLFLDVPADAVTSPRLDEPVENSGALNNDLDFNWKSLAWLRLPHLPGPEQDLLLLRFDVAEPLLHLLRTEDRPAADRIVGWMLFEHKLAYVVLVDLAVEADQPPATALGLLAECPR